MSYNLYYRIAIAISCFASFLFICILNTIRLTGLLLKQQTDTLVALQSKMEILEMQHIQTAVDLGKKLDEVGAAQQAQTDARLFLFGLILFIGSVAICCFLTSRGGGGGGSTPTPTLGEVIKASSEAMAENSAHRIQLIKKGISLSEEAKINSIKGSILRSGDSKIYINNKFGAPTSKEGDFTTYINKFGYSISKKGDIYINEFGIPRVVHADIEESASDMFVVLQDQFQRTCDVQRASLADSLYHSKAATNTAVVNALDSQKAIFDRGIENIVGFFDSVLEELVESLIPLEDAIKRDQDFITAKVKNIPFTNSDLAGPSTESLPISPEAVQTVSTVVNVVSGLGT